MYSLIVTCKLNDIDPQAWLSDVLARIAGYPSHRLGELLPWSWNKMRPDIAHQKPPDCPASATFSSAQTSRHDVGN
jgi:hypothetical protein